MQIYWPELRAGRFRVYILLSIIYKKIEDLVRIIFYVTMAVENIFRVSLLTRNRREAHMFYLARKVGNILRCCCWEKGNFIMIIDFKCGQTWKIRPSPPSLSLYSTFKYSFFVLQYHFCFCFSLEVKGLLFS